MIPKAITNINGKIIILNILLNDKQSKVHVENARIWHLEDYKHFFG